MLSLKNLIRMEKYFVLFGFLSLFMSVILLSYFLFKKKNDKFGIFQTVDSLKKEGYSNEKIELMVSHLTKLYFTVSHENIKTVCQKVKALPVSILMDEENFKKEMNINN